MRALMRAAKPSSRRPRAVRCALAFALALLAAPAGALTLQVDPARSAITPHSGGAGEPLSGSLDVTLGSVPVVTNTTFDVTGLDLAAGGGAQIDLDPAAPSPGLGVITPDGQILIGTLFLRIQEGGEATLLAIPDVPGQATFSADGGLREVRTAFALGAPELGLLDVTLTAVPEPGGALLLGVLGLGLAARRPARGATLGRKELR